MTTTSPDPHADPAAFLAVELMGWRFGYVPLHSDLRWIKRDGTNIGRDDWNPLHDLNDAFALVPRLRDWLEALRFSADVRVRALGTRNIASVYVQSEDPNWTETHTFIVENDHPAEALTLAIRDVVVAVRGAG